MEHRICTLATVENEDKISRMGVKGVKLGHA